MDELLLNRGQLFQRNLHPQVAARHHYAVSDFDNIVHVGHAGVVFNFGEDQDAVPAVLV